MKQYESYKPSGVDWIGEIPEEWEVIPGLSFIYENKAKNKGMIRNTVLSLSYGKIRIKLENELTGLVPESFETYQLVNTGDLIFRPTDLQNDMTSLRSSISEYDGIITSAYLNFRFKKNANPKFFHYFFRSIDNNKVIYGLGSGLRQNISYLDFKRFYFPFPPLHEQKAIAKFLDDKTEMIDATIVIKQKEIELLKERRQILIQKAVTQGLDSNATMKESGIDWIGKIPEHWEVRKIKFLGRVRSGESVTNNLLTDNGKYEVFGGNGKMGYYDRFNVNKENIIIGRVGAYCGNVRLINTKKWVSDNALILRLFNTNLYNYIAKALEIGDLNKLNMSNAQPLITGTKVMNFYIPFPNKDERQQLVQYIKKIEEKIAKAISIKKQEIEKLKEYKTVLIDSVVTGKVKIC